MTTLTVNRETEKKKGIIREKEVVGGGGVVNVNMEEGVCLFAIYITSSPEEDGA